MRLLHNAGAGKIGMFIGVIGVELLFATGVYYMVSVLSSIVFPDIASNLIAVIVAAFIFFLGVNLFLNGEYTLRDIEEYELENGKYVRKDKQGNITGYYNKLSRKVSVYVQYGIVIAADLCGLGYRVILADKGVGASLLIFLFFGLLACLPIIIGHSLYAQMNKPVSAVQRDYTYASQIKAIHEDNRRVNVRRDEKASTNPTERRANAPLVQDKAKQQALPSPRPSSATPVEGNVRPFPQPKPDREATAQGE